MKFTLKFYSFIFFLSTFFIACASTKYTSFDTVVDPTCGMKLNKSESYVCKYNGVKYYFDSYVCKEAFKSNPKIF
jgi:YHS domain-containing protein